MYGGGGMGYGGGGMGYGGMGFNPNYAAPNYPQSLSAAPITGAAAAAPSVSTTGTGLTGAFLGTGAQQQQTSSQYPHVIPNPFDNTLLVQGTPQDWEQIKSLLRQLDIPPRQVLIDAKIYEVDLTGAFSARCDRRYLDKKDTGTDLAHADRRHGQPRGLALSTGALVLRSHELLAALNASEPQNHSRVISAPSIIATDSIPATMNVGDRTFRC